MAMDIEVVRSARRRRTAEAEIVHGVIRVRVPADLSAEEERQYVSELVGRLERRYGSLEIDLTERARRLADRYGLPRPASIRWVDNQRARWGSCTVDTGHIRISRRLAGFPSWVIDYLVVHEVAHLVEPDHSPAFQHLVDRYPKAERARGFLIAKDLDEGCEPGLLATSTSLSSNDKHISPAQQRFSW